MRGGGLTYVGITQTKEDKLRQLMEMMLTGMKEEREAKKEGVENKARRVEKILPYRDGSNISQFLQSLEIKLQQIRVKMSEYKCILISKLSLKVKDSCLDLITSEGLTYDEIKAKLLEKRGLCLRQAEMKLFVNWKDDCREVDRVDRCRQLKTLVDRFFLGAVSEEECKSLLMTAVYRISLSRSEQGIMDTRTIKTYQGLSELVLMLKSIAVGNKEELRSQEREGWTDIRGKTDPG